MSWFVLPTSTPVPLELGAAGAVALIALLIVSLPGLLVVRNALRRTKAAAVTSACLGVEAHRPPKRAAA
jgi:hypothetical protein